MAAVLRLPRSLCAAAAAGGFTECPVTVSRVREKKAGKRAGQDFPFFFTRLLRRRLAACISQQYEHFFHWRSQRLLATPPGFLGESARWGESLHLVQRPVCSDPVARYRSVVQACLHPRGHRLHPVSRSFSPFFLPMRDRDRDEPGRKEETGTNPVM